MAYADAYQALFGEAPPTASATPSPTPDPYTSAYQGLFGEAPPTQTAPQPSGQNQQTQPQQVSQPFGANHPTLNSIGDYINNSAVGKFFTPLANEIAAPIETNILNNANQQNIASDTATNNSLMASAKTQAQRKAAQSVIANAQGPVLTNISQNVANLSDTPEQVLGNAGKLLGAVLSGGTLGTEAGADSAAAGSFKLLSGKNLATSLLGNVGTAAALGGLSGASNQASQNASTGAIASNAARQAGESAAVAGLLNSIIPAAFKGLGKVTSGAASIFSGNGPSGAGTLGTIAGQGELGTAALQGARGQSTEDAQQLFKDATNAIDQQNASNGNGGMIPMDSVRNEAQQVLANHGINVTVATPEELQAAQNYLDNTNATDASNILTPDGNGGYTQSTNPAYGNQLQIRQAAQNVDNKYFPGQQVTSVIGPNGRSTMNGSDEAGMIQRLKSLVNNNGLVSVTADNSKLPNDTLEKLIVGNPTIGKPGIIKQIFGFGNETGPGTTSTASNLNDIKGNIRSLYKEGNAFNILQKGDKESNALSTQLANTVEAPLLQNPLYAKAMQYYQALHGGENFNSWIPANAGKVLQILNDSQAGGKSIGGALTDAAIASGLQAAGHLNPVTGTIATAASIPRVAAEGANLYGMGSQLAQKAGGNNLSPGVAALLSAIGIK